MTDREFEVLNEALTDLFTKTDEEVIAEMEVEELERMHGLDPLNFPPAPSKQICAHPFYDESFPDLMPQAAKPKSRRDWSLLLYRATVITSLVATNVMLWVMLRAVLFFLWNVNVVVQ